MYTNNLDFVAKVSGVLNKNVNVRNEHLLKNYGKYSQYTSDLTPAIGEVSTIDYDRPLYSITDDKSLLDYTHNGGGIFANMINSIYFNKEREKDIVGFDNPTQGEIESWAGKYIDYTKYIDEVLGEDVYSKHVRYINDFLSGEYIENALRQTEVGVVRDINVAVAKQGIITTNPNNMSGKDTKLGTITNYMYSTMLYNGAIFNSDRKSENKYITPSLINQYGNNLANVMELGDIMRVGVGDYNLREDLGATAKIIHNFSDSVSDLNVAWMTKNVDNAKKYISEFNKGFNGYELGKDGYIEITEADGNIFSIDDTSDFTAPSNFNKVDRIYGQKTYDIYNENDNANNGYGKASDNEDVVAWEHYEELDGSVNQKSILSRTAKLFNEHKINTLVGRFHTSVDGGIGTDAEFTDTAKTKYGNSHGRNLLTKKAQDNETADADDTNGYDNPYCRTWTYHHQYNQVKKLIRPFIYTDDNGQERALSIEDIQNNLGKYRNRVVKTDQNGQTKIINEGASYLAKNTVLDNNGFVNITPKQKVGNDEGVNVSKCMFSIENLAWKDVNKVDEFIKKEQRGPNGGRIMWFPPYDLSFNENVNVNWNSSQFIGRGEKVYTYTDTDRTGSLSFTLLIDHPSIVNSFAKLTDGDISSDIDADILRYFAGCGMPEISVIEDSGSTTGNTEDKPDPVPETGSISFYVHFPNNYTGTMNSYGETDFKLENGYEWVKLLLIGNTTVIPNDKSKWIGYEITTQGQGMSSNSDEYVDKFIGVSESCWKYAGHSNKYIGVERTWYKHDCESVDKKSRKYCFQYPVDYDLRQKLKTKDDFMDIASYGFNSVLNHELHQGATCSFGEFMCALIKSKLIDFSSEIFIGNDSNESVSDETTNINDDIYDYLVSNGCNEERIDNLVKIITDKGTKFINSETIGCADQHDKGNSDMLAKRRCFSLNSLINDTIKIEQNYNNLSGSKKSERNAGNGVSDKNNKFDRNAFVTINYEIAAKQLLSDTDSNATNEDTTKDEEVQQNKFNEFYDEISLNETSIIKEYESFKDNNDYEQTYEVFKKELKTFLDENSISYDVDEYGEDVDKYNETIDKITEKYGYDYLVNALLISGYANGQFMGKLNSHPLTELETEKIERIQDLDNKISAISSKNKKLEEEISDLEDDIDKLTKENEKLNDKIDKVKGEIIVDQTDIANKQEEINELNYQLDHWTVKYGEKAEIKIKINKLNSEISSLEREISSDKAKLEKYQLEYDNNADKIKKDNEGLVNKQTAITNNNADKEKLIEERKTEQMTTNYLVLDLVKTKVYYDEMFKKELFSFDKYKFDKNNIYPKFGDGSSTDEILSTKDILNFTKYDDTKVVEYDENKHFSYNLLLQDYLAINKLKNIDNGFDFACEYLFSNDLYFKMLKEMSYMAYLLGGDKSDDIWADANPDNSKEITYKSAWEFIIKNVDAGNSSIQYEPFKTAVSECKSAIEEYNNSDKKASDLNKLMRVIKTHTLEVLKYCTTVSEDLVNEISSEAKTKYNENKKAEQDAEEAKNATKIAKEMAEALETKKKQLDELKKQKEAYIYKIFNGENELRYESEAEYFNRIKTDDPLIHKRIVDKFKYFNPAFHSMSPEGFNARLNFLHQCTRQGHTVEPSTTTGVKTANNLSFGRMPVCVLRIGDFINTRILIQNIAINYDNNGGAQWDLNPEGIGVQPMYAKVTLGIVILGGQSLEGPISRLQNAVSFDYYANTGVYDDRADRIEISNNGEKVEYKKVFVAKSPNKNVSSMNGEVSQNVDNKRDEIDAAKVDYSDLGKKVSEMQREVEEMEKKWNNMSAPKLGLNQNKKGNSLFDL